MSTTTETISRPPRAPVASVLLTVAAIVAALVLAPATSASAAEPLPTGTYELSIDGGEATVTVGADRSVTVSASDGLVVQLAFDDQGRALDEFTVRSGETTYEVEVEHADDGSYSITVRADEVAGDGADGAVVSTVAQCAPGGLVAQSVGLPNHGTLVSAAASGLSLSVVVTDPVTGQTTNIDGDFSSLEGAEAFCDALAAAVPSIDEIRATFAEERAETAAERAAARADREAAREVAQRAREAQREAASLAREAAKEAREEAAAERSVEERGGADASTTTAGTPDGTDQSTTDDGTTTSSDDGDTTTEGGTTGEDSATEATTDGDSGGTTETTTTDTTTGNGKGGGPPTDAGSKGKGSGK